MNDSGFDWMKLTVPVSNEGHTSPAPPVSFGFNSNSDLPNSNNNTLNSNFFRNQSADQLISDRVSSKSAAGALERQYSDVSAESIPLSLTAQDLTLQESKTYMRWYSDILARTNSRTISMADVYNFLHNFKIAQEMKDKINRIFQKILHSINIGEFFALLRVISHVLQGQSPRRLLIGIKAPVPTPPSILSKKRQNDEDSSSNSDNEPDDYNNTSNNKESKTLDLDSFTQFMLTGERPDEAPRKRKSKKMKSVKFSDQVVTDVHDSYIESPVGSPLPQPEQLDYSLPMDQLLQSIKQQLSPDTEEQEILENMESQMNSFHNLNAVDSASVNGVPAHLNFPKNTENDGNNGENLLQPNMTGPAQMSAMLRQTSPNLLQPNMTGPSHMSTIYKQNHYSDSVTNGTIHTTENGYNSDLENNIKPLRPNITGPADMAKLFSPTPDAANSPVPKVTLQTFTNQMLTPETQPDSITINHTITNPSPMNSRSPLSNRPLPPPPVPAGRRTRSISSPIPREHRFSPATENVHQIFNTNVPISLPRSPLSSRSNNESLNPDLRLQQKLAPPPPPPSRRKVSNSVSTHTPPPPLPPKVVVEPQNEVYSGNNDSTANILDDLRALQEEVDKIRGMTGGF